MTRSELIQGVIVRVAVIGVPLTVMVMMSLFDLDVVEINDGFAIRGFSMFAIPALMHFQATRLRMDQPIALWVSGLALFAVAILQVDVIPNVPVVGSVSFLSLIGILSIQYPAAVWLLSYYQKVAEKAERRMDIKLGNIEPGDSNP